MVVSYNNKKRAFEETLFYYPCVKRVLPTGDWLGDWVTRATNKAVGGHLPPALIEVFVGLSFGTIK